MKVKTFKNVQLTAIPKEIFCCPHFTGFLLDFTLDFTFGCMIPEYDD